MANAHFEITLPGWVAAYIREPFDACATAEQRMDWVLRLARRHLENRGGGPFAAAVFDLDRQMPIAVGLNLVVPSGVSLAHAEVVALALAQRRLGSHDLSGPAMPRLELVTSAEPCCMCFGAIHWSGVRGLVVGARDEDVRRIGFDEGPKPADWKEHFERRGLSVRLNVLRTEAAEVLRQYADSGGAIYNPSPAQGSSESP